MSRSYWVSIFAVVGWVVLANFALAQAPNEQGIAKPTPSIKSYGSNETSNTESKASQFSLPVQIIQNQIEADHTQERERKSDEHDAKDLDAQIRAANAAERQIWIACSGVILTALGTVLLILNLWLSRQANTLSRDTLIAQTRPWLTVDNVTLKWMKIDENEVRVEVLFVVKNSGQSPAFQLMLTPLLSIEFVEAFARNIGAKKPSRKSGSFSGATVFHNSNWEYPVSFAVQKSEIEKSHANGRRGFIELVQKQGDDSLVALLQNERPSPHYYIKFDIQYEFVGSSKVHRTLGAYGIWKAHENGLPTNGRMIPYEVGDVDISNVSLFPIGEIKAD